MSRRKQTIMDGLVHQRKVKRVKNEAVYGAARLIAFLGKTLPRPAGLALFGWLGNFGYWIPNREMARTLEHLRFIYGNSLTEAEIRLRGKKVFTELGKNIFDAIRVSQADDATFSRIVTCDGFDAVRRAHAQGKGIIAITAHIGCFELLLHFFGRQGIPAFAIGQRLYDHRLDEMVSAGRSGRNITYMHRSAGPRAILRLLREGQTFGVLIDQDTDVEGVFSRFLGKLAYTPSGPVKMAMRYGIPAFVITTARQPDTTHKVFINELDDFWDTGAFEDDLVRNVQIANNRISEAIERNPEQWVWMHRRWRRKPSDPGLARAGNIEVIDAALQTGKTRSR